MYNHEHIKNNNKKKIVFVCIDDVIFLMLLKWSK
jgi:hypothetical protein